MKTCLKSLFVPRCMQTTSAPVKGKRKAGELVLLGRKSAQQKTRPKANRTLILDLLPPSGKKSNFYPHTIPLNWLWSSHVKSWFWGTGSWGQANQAKKFSAEGRGGKLIIFHNFCVALGRFFVLPDQAFESLITYFWWLSYVMPHGARQGPHYQALINIMLRRRKSEQRSGICDYLLREVIEKIFQAIAEPRLA